MSQGFALPNAPLVTELDAAEATQVCEPGRVLVEVDSRELSCRDDAMLAAYVASRRPDPVECHRLLARSLAAS